MRPRATFRKTHTAQQKTKKKLSPSFQCHRSDGNVRAPTTVAVHRHLIIDPSRLAFLPGRSKVLNPQVLDIAMLSLHIYGTPVGLARPPGDIGLDGNDTSRLTAVSYGVFVFLENKRTRYYIQCATPPNPPLAHFLFFFTNT